MAAPAELCCLERFPPHLGPLDVLLSASRFPSLFPDDNDPPTVFFRPQRPHGSAIPTILLRVHPTAEDGTTAKSRSRVCLYTSRLFMRFHRLGGLGTTGTVRAAEPVKLARVVLGARSRQSLRWATAGPFISRLHDLCRHRQPLLAREGEPLLPLPLPGEEPEQVQVLQAQLLVLDCSPVRQGQITADTAVVLTDGVHLMEPMAPPAPCSVLRLCVSDFAHCAAGLGGGRSLLDSPRLLGSGLGGVLQALERRLEVKVVDAYRHVGAAGVDVDNGVFVSSQLLLRLGLFNHEWVRLWRPGGSTQRLVSVLVVDQIQSPAGENEQEEGFISPTLWFNMTQGEQLLKRSSTLKMKRLAPPPAVVGSLCSESVCRSFSPPFASELHVQPVVSPLYEGLSCYENLLWEHFSTPRLVSQGDILTVPAENHPDLLEHGSEGIHTCRALFFRVHAVRSCMQEEGVEGGGAYLVDRLHTSLYLGAPNNSTVPHSSVDEGSPWTGLSFPGLEPTINLLSSIIAPHLQHSGVLPGCTVLLCGAAGSGKVAVVDVARRRLNLHLLKVDCVSLLGNSPATSEAKLASAFQRASGAQPCILLLRNLHFLPRPGGGAEEDSRSTGALWRLLAGVSSRVAVVATSSSPARLSAGLAAAFVHQVELESPTEGQRLAMLEALSQRLHLGMDVHLETVSRLTTGFVLGDLKALLVAAARCACRRLRHSCGLQQEELCSSGVTILKQDFSVALETLQDVQASAVGAPKIPEVHWEDIGGLQQVRKEILDTVQLPLQHPELLLGLRRTGVLLYGPPGTGKTLLAKAVATECSMSFLSVKGPELINMYVGQSEENIREVFSRARLAAPCIVFFDELDSLAPSRGRTGDSGGVMDRVVSQLLAELDALSSSGAVFVIGATNRPDLLDQSLLRPGRLDQLVFVGLAQDRPTQLQVLQAILRRFQLDSSVNLQQVVERCPAHMSGADLYALCSDAMMAAIKRKTVSMETGVDGQDSPLRLRDDDFTAALEGFQPSVSAEELLRYTRIQQHLEGCNHGDQRVL